ncbi:MAG: hypothetical protein J7559_14295 [Cohnella sp.]|nr:hypothetical protein [Cohnella sp.]
MKDSQHRLEQLELLNLLIVPLDDHRGWYRYHHLFADFLQHHFKQVQPMQWEDTHARAAAWLEANGFREKAVDHLLAGGHHAEAVRLMERLLPETSHANWHIMHRWLSLLPETAIVGKPIIDIYYIVALIDVGQWEIALKRVKQAESHLLDIKEALTESEWGQMQGAIYLLQGVAYFGHKDFDRCHEYLERYDKLMPEGNPIHKLSANSSVSSDHEDLLAHINDLSVAESFMKKRIQAWGGKRDFPIVGYFLVSYSELLYEWDRLEEAGYYAEMVLEREDVQSLARILVYAAAVASRILQAQGKADQAIKLLQQAKLRIHSPEQALFMMKIEAQQIRLALRKNASYFAADWLETCGLHSSGPINWYNSSEYLVLARLLANDGRHDQALALLERMYEALSKEDRLRDKIKVLIARSIILYRQRTIQEALIPLAEALHQAEPQGYLRSFLDEGTAMAEMLSAYLQLRQESFSRTSSMASFAYVAKLFQALNRHSRTILTEQEMRILALVDKGFTNKEIALQMHVSAETIKWHIKNVYLKLDAKNRVQALRRAKEQALHLPTGQ